jgi:DinB family protein
MFDSAIAISEFQLGQFEKIAGDIPEDLFFAPGPGHGHPPVWIMGHLAITGQLGQRMLGGSVSQPEWLPLFGPGSSDKIAKDESLNKGQLVTKVVETYRVFRDLAATADPTAMARQHKVPFFRGTPIKTVGDCITQLLTNHFGFHLAQLSSCRRAAGHPALM